MVRLRPSVRPPADLGVHCCHGACFASSKSELAGCFTDACVTAGHVAAAAASRRPVSNALDQLWRLYSDAGPQRVAEELQ